MGVARLMVSCKAWAAELGLTHESLYRTLARLEAEGQVIAWRANCSSHESRLCLAPSYTTPPPCGFPRNRLRLARAQR